MSDPLDVVRSVIERITELEARLAKWDDIFDASVESAQQSLRRLEGGARKKLIFLFGFA